MVSKARESIYQEIVDAQAEVAALVMDAVKLAKKHYFRLRRTARGPAQRSAVLNLHDMAMKLRKQIDETPAGDARALRQACIKRMVDTSRRIRKNCARYRRVGELLKKVAQQRARGRGTAREQATLRRMIGQEVVQAPGAMSLLLKRPALEVFDLCGIKRPFVEERVADPTDPKAPPRYRRRELTEAELQAGKRGDATRFTLVPFLTVEAEHARPGAE